MAPGGRRRCDCGIPVASSGWGYLLATPLYFVAILLLQPGARARAFVAAPVLVTLALYAAFRFGLLIPVPDGLLERGCRGERGAVSILRGLAGGFVSALEWSRIVAMVGGVAWGIIGGRSRGSAAPSHGARLARSCSHMDATTALVMLAGVWAGANYGGSIPAILMRIPGTPASAAALLDGYELTRQGKAAKALGVSLVCGTIGGVISIVVLIAMVLPLGEVVLQFGSPETCALAIFALTLPGRPGGGELPGGARLGLRGAPADDRRPRRPCPAPLRRPGERS